MENYIHTIPFKQIIFFLMIGGLIHFVFQFINHFLISTLIKKNKSIYILWQRIQIIVWFSFFLLFFSTLLISNFLLVSFISIFFIGFGWNFLHNLYAGIIIKYRNKLNIDDDITTGFVSGKILMINWIDTELINEQGEHIIFPNKKLLSSVIRHLNKMTALNPFTYIYQTNKSSYDKLYTQALNCPYFAVNQTVTLSKNSDNTYQIEAMLIDKSFKEKAIRYFEKLS